MRPPASKITFVRQQSALTLYQRPQITAVKAALANAGSFGFKSIVYEDIGFQK